jgi:opacity protein-like surface antigen
LIPAARGSRLIAGGIMKKSLCLAVAILGFFTFCLIPDPGSRAWGNQLGTELELTVVPVASVALLGLGGYMVWKDRLSQPPDAVGREGYHGPGEYYFGGFMGASLVSNANWSWEPIHGPDGHELQTAEKNVKTDPGLVGGLKAGYFLDSIPYLGFEGEGSIASNYRPRQVVTVKPPISGFAVVGQEQGNLIWDMAFHIVGRYGFLPDKDVPFGRLQPYIGIGPDVTVLFFQNDSAKNFGLDGEVGLRYMVTKNIGAFVEWNYIKQWDVELGIQHLTSAGERYISSETKGAGKNVHFDFDNQKIVCGLEYHF